MSIVLLVAEKKGNPLSNWILPWVIEAGILVLQQERISRFHRHHGRVSRLRQRWRLWHIDVARNPAEIRHCIPQHFYKLNRGWFIRFIHFALQVCAVFQQAG